MKYIIMCGGDYGTTEPRQFLKIKGERLIDRTIRLLKENSVEEIYISSLDKRFDNLGAIRIEHNNNYKDTNDGIKGYWLDAYYPSYEPVCYLYGDVYYSDKAIKTIVEAETKETLLFGSYELDRPDNFKGYQEPFAFKVVNQEKFKEAIKLCKEYKDKKIVNREPITWEVYRVLHGYGVNNHRINEDYIKIDDYTTDIDEPEDKERLEEIL